MILPVRNILLSARGARRLLDLLSAAAAYSLRRLRTAYDGPVVRVRRDLDNAEMDIPFCNSDNVCQETLRGFVGSQNLLEHSEQLNLWTGALASETAAVNSEVAPDGTMTADKFTVSTLNSRRTRDITLTAAGQVTFSVFLKSGGSGTWAYLSVNDTATSSNLARCWVDMSNGLIGVVQTGGTGWSGVSATSTDVGNGWYRVSITAVCSVTGITVLISNANADGNTNRTVGHSRILWGAQLNQGAPQPYSPTSRRNLATFSERFDATAWAKSASTIAANVALAPDGTMTADRLTATGVSEPSLRQSTAQAASTVNTFSVWAKAVGETSPGVLYLRNLAVDANYSGTVQFNLVAGTFSTVHGAMYAGFTTMTDAGDGWWRCSITQTTEATPINLIDIGVTDGSTHTSGTVGQSILLWGAQLEQAAVASEYQRVDAAWTTTRTGNGFVAAIYDQSGNTRNMAQATAAQQPRISVAGAIELDGSRACFRFPTAGFGLTTPHTGGWFDGPQTAFAIARCGETTVIRHILGNRAGAGRFLRTNAGGASYLVTHTAAASLTVPATTSDQNLISTRYDGTTLSARVNGGSQLSWATAYFPDATAVMIGGAGSNSPNDFIGTISEVVVFGAAISETERTNIERNQGQFYGITVA